ncbi:MAG: response regulator, partial [Bacteroidota bacterium]
HYAYQLEGLDQSWKYIQGQGEVSYTLQRAGTYTFRLKGGNNDGVWNQRERQLVITVLPPPWRSPGAYWIYAGLGLVLLLGGYRFIQMRHHLQLEKLTTAQQEALHQAKLRFYTNVTHEFRTPLTLILGPIEDLLRKGVSAGGERQLQAIQHNAKRLLRLVNQLLNFRSLEHNHEQMEVAEGNFVRFAKEVSLSFREQARIKGIDFQFETSSEELRLWYDRDKMEKVFYNLLSNAFKFTPAGGSITFRLTEYETELGVEVRDSGPGIPAKLRLKIFDRYVHQESHAQATLVGTGIGLALAKQLVEMHGGQIWLGDSSTKGACFYVLLPKGKDHYGPQEILSDFKSSENFQAYVEKSTHEAMAKSLFKDRPDPEQPRPKLLVVEDNEQVRSYVQGIFDAYFEVLLGANGQQGLAQAKEHSPDLIISDIMMPKMDGIELCRQLKSQVKTSHIPVILLTARTGQIFRVEGLETGADAYLTKPFSPYELQLKVYNLLEARSRIRERFHSVLKLEPKEITVTSADEAFLTKAIEIVEQYMEDTEFTVEVFAQELAVSRPLLFTKIKAITNQTPNNFVKSLRMKRSAQLLAQSDLGVAEIAYQVGFRDARYFSKCFQKEFGKTPSEFRTISSGQIAEQTTP